MDVGRKQSSTASQGLHSTDRSQYQQAANYETQACCDICYHMRPPSAPLHAANADYVPNRCVVRFQSAVPVNQHNALKAVGKVCVKLCIFLTLLNVTFRPPYSR
jgi:hypothetical protein